MKREDGNAWTVTARIVDILPVIRLNPITPQTAKIFKAVRLRALHDTPSAFGSTYAKESQLTDGDWVKRAERWGTPGGSAAGFIAMDGETACGIVCSFLDEEDATRAHLISMWTAPTHRRQGLGLRLVNEVLAWAGSRGARTMLLMVTSNNVAAIRFYERLGFARTGRTEPYPHDQALSEYQMSRHIPEAKSALTSDAPSNEEPRS